MKEDKKYKKQQADVEFERSLRPKIFDEVIGREKEKMRRRK